MVDLNNTQDSASAPVPVDGAQSGGALALLLTVSCPLIAIVFLFVMFKFLCHHKNSMISSFRNTTFDLDQTGQHDCTITTDAEKIVHCVISVELFVGETTTGEDNAPQCSICLGDLADGDKVKILPKCRHVFHPECIDMWLMSSHSSCPLCRACLVSGPVVDDHCMAV